MAAVRFLIAGSVMYFFLRVTGAARPIRLHWKSAAIVGGLLLLGGNGGVVWAQQTVPSSIAAMLITSVPIWMVLLDWLRPNGVRPSLGVAAGVIVGFSGVGLLVGTGDQSASQSLRIGALILVGASFCWSLGSVWSRRLPLPSSPLMATAMEMLCGGALLLIAGMIAGEWGRFAPERMTLRSLLSVGYLIVFGSLIAFSCYVWLLKVSTPARVATYAFVNPVVAVFLGVTLGGEPFTAKTLLASIIILAGVVLITLKGRSSNGKTRAIKSATRSLNVVESHEGTKITKKAEVSGLVECRA
jgi:drug/metabolite transporter (DMT)-like permease